jgi:hypothetical protein
MTWHICKGGRTSDPPLARVKEYGGGASSSFWQRKTTIAYIPISGNKKTTRRPKPCSDLRCCNTDTPGARRPIATAPPAFRKPRHGPCRLSGWGRSELWRALERAGPRARFQHSFSRSGIWVIHPAAQYSRVRAEASRGSEMAPICLMSSAACGKLDKGSNFFQRRGRLSIVSLPMPPALLWRPRGRFMTTNPAQNACAREPNTGVRV